MKNKKMLKKLFALLAVVMMIGCMAVPAFATSTADTADVAVSAMQSALDEVIGTVTIGNVLIVISACIAASIGLVFFWWAVRKAIRAVMSAFRKGKVSV